ncbi:hypothetical protein MTO96_035275 [Rhipicephalus appendiculatus]
MRAAGRTAVAETRPYAVLSRLIRLPIANRSTLARAGYSSRRTPLQQCHGGPPLPASDPRGGGVCFAPSGVSRDYRRKRSAISGALALIDSPEAGSPDPEGASANATRQRRWYVAPQRIVRCVCVHDPAYIVVRGRFPPTLRRKSRGGGRSLSSSRSCIGDAISFRIVRNSACGGRADTGAAATQQQPTMAAPSRRVIILSAAAAGDGRV